MAVSLPLRDALMWGLVPLLRTRGYSALPVHFLGKAATFNLLYAFPLLLLGDGEGRWPPSPRSSAGRSRSGASASTGGPGVLYAWQVRKLLRRPPSDRRPPMPTTPDRRDRPAGTGPALDRCPPGSRCRCSTLITQQSLDEDYLHVAERRAAASDRAGARPARPRSRPIGAPGAAGTVAVIAVFGVLVDDRRRADLAQRRRRRRRAAPRLIERIEAQRDRVATIQQRPRRPARAQRRPPAAADPDRRGRADRRRRGCAGSRCSTGFVAVTGEGVRVVVDERARGRPRPGGLRRRPGPAGQRAVERRAPRRSRSTASG